MKHRTLFIGILGLLAMTMLWGCGGDDNGSGNGVPTQPSMQEITVPQGLQDAANSGDTYASLAVTYIGLANSFAANSTYFQPPSKSVVPTKSGAVEDTTTWTYTYGEYSWTITYGTYEDEDYYYWDIWFDGYEYSNCKYIDYKEAKDGSSGVYQWYSDCGTTPYWVWTWTLSALDVYTVTMVSETYSFEIVVNPDGSGTMTSYYGDLNSQEQYVFTWTSSGSGTYVYYDEDGSTNDSGSWS